MADVCPNPNHFGVHQDYRTGVLRCASCDAWVRELRADEYISRKHKRYASYKKALRRAGNYKEEKLSELRRVRAHERQMAEEFPDQAESDIALGVEPCRLTWRLLGVAIQDPRIEPGS